MTNYILKSLFFLSICISLNTTYADKLVKEANKLNIDPITYFARESNSYDVEIEWSVNDRKEIAALLLKEFKKINTHVPNLSPESKKWLNEELSGSGNRLSNAMSTKEYSLDIVKMGLERLVLTLELLNKEIGINEDAEMYFWSTLRDTYYLIIFDYYKELQTASHYGINIELKSTYESVGDYISMSIITPYLFRKSGE